jgi:hypothetical protein
MIGKFNVYDFLADLLPGLVVLWCLEQILKTRGVALPITFSGNFAEASMLIVFGFLVGLFLQRVGERLIDPVLKWLWQGFPSGRWLLPDNTEYPFKNRVIELISKHFGVSTEADTPAALSAEENTKRRMATNQAIFYLSYNYVDQHKLSERPLIFNAQYGMFRGLLTAFVIILIVSVGLLWKLWVNDCRSNLMSIISTFLLIPLILLAYAGCKKRGENFARSIYDLFITSDLAIGKP